MISQHRFRFARERGMVTAETMMVLPFVFVVTVVLAWLISTVVTQARLMDASAEAARLGARGESTSAVQHRAKALAPDGADVAIEHTPNELTVRISVQSDLWLFRPVSRTVSAESVAAKE